MIYCILLLCFPLQCVWYFLFSSDTPFPPHLILIHIFRWLKLQFSMCLRPISPQLCMYIFIFILLSFGFLDRHSTDREVALMMLLAYLSYMLAEVFRRRSNFYISSPRNFLVLLQSRKLRSSDSVTRSGYTMDDDCSSVNGLFFLAAS